MLSFHWDICCTLCRSCFFISGHWCVCLMNFNSQVINSTYYYYFVLINEWMNHFYQYTYCFIVLACQFVGWLFGLNQYVKVWENLCVFYLLYLFFFQNHFCPLITLLIFIHVHLYDWISLGSYAHTIIEYVGLVFHVFKLSIQTFNFSWYDTTFGVLSSQYILYRLDRKCTFKLNVVRTLNLLNRS